MTAAILEGGEGVQHRAMQSSEPRLWKKLTAPALKFNCDALVDSNANTTGLGGVIRDSD